MRSQGVEHGLRLVGGRRFELESESMFAGLEEVLAGGHEDTFGLALCNLCADDIVAGGDDGGIHAGSGKCSRGRVRREARQMADGRGSAGDG